jgi:hypothetical protein
MRPDAIALRGALLAGLLAVSGPVRAEEALWRAVEALRHDGAYRDASAWRRAQVRALTGDLVRGLDSGVVPEGAIRRAADADLRLHAAEAWVLLTSLPENADGFIAVHRGPGGPPLILEAPHAWYDRGTGRLACMLFEGGVGRALLVNTAHRESPSQGDLSGGTQDLGSDVAHRPASVFQAATLGAADALNDPLVVQIHGFSAEHGSWAAVVSEGPTLSPARHLAQAQASLAPLLARWGPVATGDQVPALAARTNSQGKALAGQARFLHVELSAEVRAALLADPDLRERFGHTLAHLAERRP